MLTTRLLATCFVLNAILMYVILTLNATFGAPGVHRLHAFVTAGPLVSTHRRD